MRINKYLALKKYATRREADELIAKGLVRISGKKARLGDQVHISDSVVVENAAKTFRYYAFHKPRGIITHSAQEGEEEITEVVPMKGVFPIGRLDKDSHGLIILTDDGRITDPLLNPKSLHEKEYSVRTTLPLPKRFAYLMSRGVDIGGYTTKRARVTPRGEKSFSIVLTEGKKHQIRRMCGAFGVSIDDLKRVRIMNIKLGTLKEGAYREIRGAERSEFLAALGLS